jgi:signal transduction histidine kinase
MQRVFLLFFFLIMTFFSQAQSFEIERHQKLIQDHPQQDSFRVNRLNEICNLAPSISIEQMEKYAAEALVLARRLKYSKGEGYALLVNARAATIKGDIEASAKMYQQTDSLAKLIGDQILQWWVMLRSTNNIDNNQERISRLLNAEAFAIKLNNNESIVITQIAIASGYYTFGNYAQALEYGIKSLKNAEAFNNPKYLYRANDILSSIYSSIGEYDKANSYLQQQPALQKQLGYQITERSTLYNALGENARLAKKYSEAIKYYQQAVATSSENTQGRVVPVSNLADVYTSMDSLSLAFHYAAEATAGNKIVKRADLDSWIESILARAYMKQHKVDSALYHASSGFAKAFQFGVMEDMVSTLKTMADAYELKGDYRNAYISFTRFINYRDSVQGVAVKNKTSVLEHNFEMAKKEDQIALLNQEKKLQKNFLASALIVLGLILISAILLLRNVRQKQKANQLLQLQKKEIDEKAQQLLVQKDTLQQSYDNVELLGEIGRKITSSLSVNQIIGTVYNNVNALMDASIFGIGIYHEATKSIDFPATYEKGHALPAYSNSIYDQNRLAGLCFTNGKEIVINDLGNEYNNYLQNIPTPIEGDQPSSLIFLPLKAKEKMFGVITVQSFSKNAFTDYHLNMLRTIAIYAAIALENAESFDKLNETVKNLKQTQAQLIQSEKMASLGELTAGIAHEIQNPLNFVNNFSEVNKELLAEMNYEIDQGNYQEVKAIAKDITANEEKINHHGKRADAIVKGMLQHSRSSNGAKEPTDINALADEYLRLAYHGLRAKDKSFNATLQTEYDESIRNINIITQDIGRVILNLITNAFYAVDEKKKHLQSPEGGVPYEPTVTVSTKRSNGKVEISVIDNGNGIPSKVLDKIFQPFFTTKPTGQGTGLGLSLSYDIIMAHGGQLKVETKEREGSAFIIQLPGF